MRNAYRQEQIRALLEAAEGETISLPVMLRTIYGVVDKDADAAFRSSLNRLRMSRPDLEIEYVGGYRLKRDGMKRDRGGALDPEGTA